jgi:hypothetical protein
VAWHAGPTANHSRIGIELCVPKTKDDDKFNKVWNNAVELSAYLMKNVLKQSTVTKDNIMSHAEVSDKWKQIDHQDLVNYFKQYGKNVDDFRAAVQMNPELSTKWTKSFWARGYYVSTVGNVTEETIKKYIQGQQEEAKIEETRR